MKAEEVAMEYCCEKCVHNKLGCSMKLLSHGRDCIKCGNYIKGYQQAEKDLALTWKDIADIENITTEILKECDNKNLYDTEEGFCQEVLKRFKERKGE